MSICPIELPQCKRTLMSRNKPYEKKQCPLNIKPRCSLVPPSCPLLPQDNVCGLSKIQDQNTPLDVSECPAKSPCLLAPPGCPISLPCTSASSSDNKNTTVSEMPFPCPLESCSQNRTTNEGEQKSDTNKKISISVTKDLNIKSKANKTDVPKCPVSSNMRPFPCSECILDDLSLKEANGDRSKVKACPFLKIADTCGPCCDCADVPEIDIGPRCPFLPKPCQCCSTPRCPLTKKPDCELNPKPECGLLKPPCCCGTNFLGEPCIPCQPPKCPLSQPLCLCGTCKPSSLRPPSCVCICSKCPSDQVKCPLSSPSCGGCLLGIACGLIAPKCVCGKCPLTLPPCIKSPCCCSCGSRNCPLITPCCAINSTKPQICPGSCPISSIPCPLTLPPTCPPTSDPCPLLKKPICPPIPPPCSTNKYELNSEPAKTTFHVPLCPQYKPQCKIHIFDSGDGGLVCPFAPHPCPLGPTCPFPVAIQGGTKSKKQLVKPTLEKDIKALNEETIINTGIQASKVTTGESCPGSALCGILPQPECPAAEILIPDRYVKKQKEKKELCPFKECMRKPECPLSQAMPNVKCPMGEDSSCPLAKEPDCPLSELANKCPILGNQCSFIPPGCPLSSCPSKPSCQVATLSNKSKLIKNNSCPLSKPTDCALSAITKDCPLLPKIECPLAQKPDCPLAPKPECPIAEFLPITECPPDRAHCPLAPQPKCPISGAVIKPCPLGNPPKCVLDGLVPKETYPANTKTECAPSSESERPKRKQQEELLALTQNDSIINSKQVDNAGKMVKVSLKLPSECVLSQIQVSPDTRQKSNDGRLKLNGATQRTNKIPSMRTKASEKDCPLTDFIPKRNCPLAPPPCPLTPKPACPLTRKPDPCPLEVNKNKPYCPVEYPPCKRFPEGRCPMGDLNLCECDYPVSPCLLPPQAEGVIAPPQYCTKENCCMGLALPPLGLTPRSGNKDLNFENGYYYAFMDTKPGKEDTKHFVQLFTEPPVTKISLFGEHKERLHNNWTILKSGEGFKKCKNVAKKLEKMGPYNNVSSQYNESDCPLDPETIRIMENRKKQKREMKEIEMLKETLGLKS